MHAMNFLKKTFCNSKSNNHSVRSLRFEEVEQRIMLTVPAFASNPSSTNKIYLDFDGHTTAANSFWSTPRRYGPGVNEITAGTGGAPIFAPVYTVLPQSEMEFS